MKALWLSAVIAVCAASIAGTAASAQGVPSGSWTGELLLPNGPPLAAAFVVSTEGDSANIVMKSMVCLRASCELTDVGVRGDTISFSWTAARSPIPCALNRRSDGIYRGGCHGVRDTIPMTMIPPESSAPTGLARIALEKSGFDWLSDKDGQFHIYFVPDSYAHRHLDAIRSSAVKSQTRGLHLLGEESYPSTISLFYVDSREQMRELVGYPAGGWADPFAGTVILVTSPSGETADTHEIMHVLAMNLWGVPAAPHDWISEGLAIFATGGFCDYSVERLAAHMYQQNLLIPSDTLTTHFRQHDDLIGSLQAGSLVQFIHRAYGNDKLRSVWQHGVVNAPELLGTTFDELVMAWEDRIRDGVARHEPVNWALVENQCSRGGN